MTRTPARSSLALALLLLQAPAAWCAERALAAPDLALPPAAVQSPLSAPGVSGAAEALAVSADQPGIADPVVAVAPAAAGAPSPAEAAPAGDAAPATAWDAAFDGAAARVHGFLEELRLPYTKRRHGGESFILPNERHPEDARLILSEAKPGAYVSVGTERGFIGAAMAGSSHLLLVDRDQAVVAYNRANAALLRLARTRAEYVKLRRADASVVLRLARRRGFSAVERDRLTDDLVVFGPSQKHNAVVEDRGGEYFRGVNYLEHDAWFARLKALADAGRVKAVRLDLNSPDAGQTIARALAGSGVRLGVLDLSNAWWPQYLGYGGFARLVEAFSTSADQDSLVVMTDPTREKKNWGWAYFGFRPYRGEPGAVQAVDMTSVAGQLWRYPIDKIGTPGAPPPQTLRQRLRRLAWKIF